MQEENGGLKDKPGKSRDFYHTCYALSGLSVSQHIWSDDVSLLMPRAVLGPYSNLLEPIHPLFNVVLERYHEARDFFTTFWLSNIIVLWGDVTCGIGLNYRHLSSVHVTYTHIQEW